MKNDLCSNTKTNNTYFKIYSNEKRGPIIIIEDDHDDQEILLAIFTELNYTNKLIFFKDGLQAWAFLMKI